MNKQTFLVVGDVHGQFDRLRSIQSSVQADGCFLVGDVETVRHESDLEELTGPDVYNEVRDFPAYWTGERSLPLETWFIGGNHEVWSLLHDHNPEHGHDAEIAPNMKYLGRCGIQIIQGLTVAYLSGVYGESSFAEPSMDRLRWAKDMDWQKSRRTAHFRQDEVNRLIDQTLEQSIDILVTHEWPRGTDFDHEPKNEEVQSYGVKPITDLVRWLDPTVHIAGHMHEWVDTTIDGNRFLSLDKIGSENQNDHAILEFQPDQTMNVTTP